MKGFDEIRKILEQMEQYLEKHSVKNVTDIIGVAAEKVLPLDKADRSRRYFAQVDYEKCVGCKKCFPVCIYGAISNDGKQPVIDPEKCVKCYTCIEACPFDAIQEVEIDG